MSFALKFTDRSTASLDYKLLDTQFGKISGKESYGKKCKSPRKSAPHQMLKASAVYLSGNLANKAIPFALLPILTRYLSPAEFGLVALFQLSISLTSTVVGMNIKANIARNYFSVTASEFNQILSSIYTVVTICFVIVQVLFGFSYLFDANPFGIPDKWFIIVPLVSLMTVLNGISLTLNRVKGQAWKFIGIDVSNGAIAAAITIYLVVVMKLGWEGRAIALTFCSVCYGLLSLYLVVGTMTHRPVVQWSTTKDVLKVSLPLFPHALSAVVITASDRIFIDKMLGTEATGIYTVGYQFGAVAFIFSDAYIKAWSPWFYRKMSSPSDRAKRKIVNLTYASLAGILLIAVAYSAAAIELLPFFVDDSFIGAREYVSWVSFSCVAYALYQCFFPYLVYAKKTGYLAFSSSVAMLANLGLNYWLINAYGAIGAAYATFWAYLISAALVVVAANFYVKMPWLVRTRINQ